MVFLSWRCKNIVNIIFDGKDVDDRHGMMVMKRIDLLLQFWEYVLDILTFIPGAIVVAMLWRIWPMCVDMYSEETGSKRRKVVLRQMVLSFRDFPFWVMFVILLACVWRWLSFFSSLASLTRNRTLVSKSSKLQPTAVRLITPPEGGLKLEVKCQQRDPGSPLPSDISKNAFLNIAGTAFFDNVNAAFGKVVENVLHASLPLNCEKIISWRYEDASEEELQDTKSPEKNTNSGDMEMDIQDDIIVGVESAASKSVVIRFDFAVTAKQSTIHKKLRLLSPSLVPFMQTRFGGDEDVLFNLCVNTGALLQSAVEERWEEVKINENELAFQSLSDTWNEESNQIVQDKFWVVIGAEFAQACLDILYLILAILTLIAPWRFFMLLFLLLEPTKNFSIRVRHKSIQMMDMSRSLFSAFMKEVQKEGALAVKGILPKADDFRRHEELHSNKIDVPAEYK